MILSPATRVHQQKATQCRKGLIGVISRSKNEQCNNQQEELKKLLPSVLPLKWMQHLPISKGSIVCSNNPSAPVVVTEKYP